MLTFVATFFVLVCLPSSAFAAVPSIPFTVTLSESVTITGSPRIILDVDGTTRYAVYSSGSGTASLTFTYTATAGDVDLNGIGIASTSLDLNGGSVTDLNGNVMSNLTFTPPANMGSVNVNYPSLSMDFIYDADGRYTLNGTAYNDLTSFLSAAGGSFTRASTATYFDSTGTMQTAASGALRFDYDPSTLLAEGLLIEPSRTNSIRNGQGAGAVTGSPGTLPTNWFGNTITSSGLNYEVLTAAASASLGYIDLRIYGTATSMYPVLYFEPSTQITASSGQIWALSCYVKQIGGSTSGMSGMALRVVERDAGGGIVTTQEGIVTVLSTGTLEANRVTRVFTLSGGAGTAYAHPGLRLMANVGGAIDITLRVGGCQLELGSHQSSYIPTTSGATTRAADNFNISTGAWFNLNASTLYMQGEAIDGLPTAGSFMTGFGTNGNDYLGFPYASAGTFNSSSYYRSGGAGPIISASGALSLNTVFKAAYAYSTTDGTSSYVKNGNTVATGSGVTTMGSAAYLSLGYAPFATTPMNSHFLNIKYYPRRASDAQIQLLTTP